MTRLLLLVGLTVLLYNVVVCLDLCVAVCVCVCRALKGGGHGQQIILKIHHCITWIVR